MCDMRVSRGADRIILDDLHSILTSSLQLALQICCYLKHSSIINTISVYFLSMSQFYAYNSVFCCVFYSQFMLAVFVVCVTVELVLNQDTWKPYWQRISRTQGSQWSHSPQHCYSGRASILSNSVLCCFNIAMIRNVERIIELVMIRDNMLQLSSNVFSLMDIRDIISFLCTDWLRICMFLSSFFIFHYFLCVLCVRFHIK